jgi:hypothetical protein
MNIQEFKDQLPAGVSLRPILFSTPMVLAILEGSKTQTRRTIKPQPFNNKQYSSGNGHKEWFSMNGSHNNTPESWLQFCPFGKTGDILWVRETFFDSEKHKYAPFFDARNRYLFKADEVFIGDHKWKPSIHMPFEAARLFLRIKSVTVERLKSISEQDAITEGIGNTDGLPTGLSDYYIDYNDHENCFSSPINSFKSLWESINGEASWNANPWVWVIEFEKITREEALNNG